MPFCFFEIVITDVFFIFFIKCGFSDGYLMTEATYKY